jgi:peptidoglycan/xylan/chitin deacetylase (PgdA/CDA1 family)
MLDWAQLPDLVSAGVELGAHSHSHPQLDTLSAGALREELDLPRDLLEQSLGQEVPLVAYPHGYHGPRVRRAARASGYRAAAAVRNRLHHPGESPFAISRLMLAAHTSVEELTGWLDGTDRQAGPDRESPTTTGWRVYRRTRALLTRRPGTDYR